MSKLVQFQASPEQAKNDYFLKKRIRQALELPDEDFQYVWRKRSVDARKRNIRINCTIEVYLPGEEIPSPTYYTPQDVHNGPEVAIIGAGPAGLYAALHAIEKGIKPVIFERGKDVRARRRDLALLNKESIVNPESNYCFGEGGAGTYSDGKLYTRSKKRGDVLKVLQWLVHFGADEDILVDAHPHIGTNKLPQLITAMRETILAAGGVMHFEARLTDLIIEKKQLKGIVINEKDTHSFERLILATGHSARDIYELLHRKNIALQAKPFALGVRVEHTQELIDKIQYHGRLHDDYLPPASYALATQVKGKGVYSFCMCPGGIIAPCATAPGEVVTNGWSPSRRNNPYSNAGIVVSITPEELPGYTPDNPLICLAFQQSIEQACCQAAGGAQQVPAQRLKDFMDGKVSVDFPRSSYQPGIVPVDLNTVLPPFITSRLKRAFIDFNKKMRGFLTNDAVLHAPESRTSSPVHIPRDESTWQHPDVKGLYPCGEGAGYAGGIVSAAMDGMKCMEQVVTPK